MSFPPLPVTFQSIITLLICYGLNLHYYYQFVISFANSSLNNCYSADFFTERITSSEIITLALLFLY